MNRLRVATFLLVLSAFSLSPGAGAAEPAWTHRVEAALKRLLGDAASALQIATVIQKITHPSGSQPFLIGYQVFTVGPEVKDPADAFTVVVTMKVAWTGAFQGSRTVSVRWELDCHQHLSAIVDADDAPIHVSKENAAKLDDYFRQLYPSVMKASQQR